MRLSGLAFSCSWSMAHIGSIPLPVKSAQVVAAGTPGHRAG